MRYGYVNNKNNDFFNRLVVIVFLRIRITIAIVIIQIIMGIYGFGSLRDRFASLAYVRQKYIVCFDVTPMVVTAIRNSTNIEEFTNIFRHRMLHCKEMVFLQNNPPLMVHYTLDNRSPRAKRQTQLQRAFESQSLISRITAPWITSSKKITKNETQDDKYGNNDNKSTIKTSNAKTVHRKNKEENEEPTLPSNSTYVEAQDKVTIVEYVQQQQFSLRISDVVDVVKEILLNCSEKIIQTNNEKNDDDIATQRKMQKRTKNVSTVVDFDYDEGEGEIKVLNWLSEKYVEDSSIDLLIMARDNDIYVYLLSKLQNQHNTQSKINDQQRTYKKSKSNGRYLVYHESSNTVLYCWHNIPKDTVSKVWVLQLWLSMCFGNDFVHGMLEKSTEVVQRYYDILEREFLRYAKHFDSLNSFIIAKSYDRLQKEASSSTSSISSVECNQRIDQASAIDQIILAIWFLQRILRGDQHITVSQSIVLDDNTVKDCTNIFIDDIVDDNNTATDKTWYSLRKREYRCWKKRTNSSTNNFDFNNKKQPRLSEFTSSSSKQKININKCKDPLRYWIARQLWSFFYIIELPQNFTKNQHFTSCPAIRINAAFDKPFLRKESFTKLNISHIAVLARSIFLHGI